MKELLETLNACKEAREWAGDKSWPEIFETCHRGDWLLWLHARTNPDDLRVRTLAKAHCTNTVRHLMKDKRSTDAIDVAIRFGNGETTLDELTAAYTAAAAAAYAAAAYDAAYADRSAARKANQMATADACRKYLPIEIWNIKIPTHA